VAGTDTDDIVTFRGPSGGATWRSSRSASGDGFVDDLIAGISAPEAPE